MIRAKCKSAPVISQLLIDLTTSTGKIKYTLNRPNYRCKKIWAEIVDCNKESGEREDLSLSATEE